MNNEKILEEYENKSNEELKNELYPHNPSLFYEIAKQRQYKVKKKYKKYADKFPVNKKLFFFESNLAKQYTGNPRYIYERMIEKYPDFKYVWAYNGDEDNVPGNAKTVERKSKKYYKYLAKSGVVINNTVFPLWFLRDETFYLQTWHGTPYKKLHWDRDAPYGFSSPNFYAKSRGWDCLLSPNHYSTSKFKSAFRYDGEILESGYPANDIFYNEKDYENKGLEIRKKLNIAPESKVFLYAPTWRDGSHLGNHMFKFNLLFNPDEFLKNAPENSVLLIRTHHMSDEGESLKNLNKNIIDVSMWDDAIELMCASDVLITDYSSIVFDWYCSKKPVLYYVPDLKEYETQLRGTYFDIRKLNCGTICESEKELYDNLNIEKQEFYEEFYNTFCSIHNGKSADKVIEYILNKVNIPVNEKNSPKRNILNKLKIKK